MKGPDTVCSQNPLAQFLYYSGQNSVARRIYSVEPPVHLRLFSGVFDGNDQYAKRAIWPGHFAGLQPKFSLPGADAIAGSGHPWCESEGRRCLKIGDQGKASQRCPELPGLSQRAEEALKTSLRFIGLPFFLLVETFRGVYEGCEINTD
jgi:hypothetical protein